MSVVVLVLVLLLVLAAAGVLVASVLTGETQWAWISVGCSGVAAVLLVVDRVRRRRARAGTPGESGPQHALRRRTRAERKADRAQAKAAAVPASGGASDDTDASSGTAQSETGPAGTAHADTERLDAEQPATPHSGHLASGQGSAQPGADPAEPDRHSPDEAAVEPDRAVPSGAELDRSEPGSTAPEHAEPDGAPVDEAEPEEEDTDAADSLLVSESEDGVLVVDERPRYHLDSCSWLGARETIPLPIREARELGFSPCATCGPDATLADRLRARR